MQSKLCARKFYIKESIMNREELKFRLKLITLLYGPAATVKDVTKSLKEATK